MCCQNGSDAPAHATLPLRKGPHESVDASAAATDDSAHSSSPPKALASDGEQPLPMSNILFIFDWDDTLLCTSFLQKNADVCLRLPAGSMHHLRGLANGAKRLLELSIAAGRVFIITNAEAGWVEQSAAMFLPEVVPLLAKIEIISARACFECEFPGNMHMWKKAAFLDLQRRFDMDTVTSLISLGDSDFEMQATHTLSFALGSTCAGGGNVRTESPGVLVKTVKFRPHPSPQELEKEMNLVTEKFDRIVASKKNLNIQFKEVSLVNAAAAA